MTNLLFQTEDKKKVFSEAKRILKPGGKILVVDWLPKSPLGPGKGRVSPEEVKKISKDNGLNFEKELKAGFHHYGIILEKS
jgi:ubiquinone/menaquinone biosynthesis C-methylase UbiE